ncbi:MAG: hypothetical protein NT003_04970 [Candidatus Magasanikbacteria bacterium]|nr:hypothetical protein [Candidatus Magasanikbacteria bacterium]
MFTVIWALITSLCAALGAAIASYPIMGIIVIPIALITDTRLGHADDYLMISKVIFWIVWPVVFVAIIKHDPHHGHGDHGHGDHGHGHH